MEGLKFLIGSSGRVIAVNGKNKEHASSNNRMKRNCQEGEGRRAFSGGTRGASPGKRALYLGR